LYLYLEPTLLDYGTRGRRPF